MATPDQQGAQQAIDPYRIFFPLGCAFALWGATVWLAFDRGLIAYPGQLHADLMIGGFLLSFSIGFLLTAVPRFTGTARATTREMWLVGWPLLLQALAETSLFGGRWRAALDHGAIAVGLALLVGRLAPRYFRRQQEPPPTFIIAGVGLLAGLLGAALLTMTDLAGSTSQIALLGRLLLLHCFMPALVLGVGGRLIPTLLGRAPTPLQPLASTAARPVRMLVAMALVFVAGFFVEAFAQATVGRLIEAGAATFIALRFWELHKWPLRQGVQPVLLWLSAWSFLAGLWGYALFPAYAVHALHLTFIGGLGLTTFAIATRVVLSHGGFGLAEELTSRALLGTGVLMLLSMLMRVLAGILPFAYFHELALAAALWVVALALWSGRFLPSIRRVRPHG